VAKKPATKASPIFPICIRFPRRDLQTVRAAAAKEGEIVTVWIREAVLLRLAMTEEGIPTPTLRFETSKGDGEPASLRLRPADYRRVRRAAMQDQQHLGSWIRAVAVARANQVTASPERAAAEVA
jgi:hypothetical protein